MAIFNFVDKEYKGVPGSHDEHITFHVLRHGVKLHNDSEEAQEQKAYERNYRAMVEDRRRQKIMQMQEEGKEVSYLDGGADLDDDSENQRNQFNYTERAAQTYNNTIKTRVVSTIPPESTDAVGAMTQWMLHDAYVAEYDKLVYAANMETTAKPSKDKKGGPGGQGSKKASDDPLHSAAMGTTLRVLERMVNVNAEDEIYQDYKYWEDASDAFRTDSGTCLPLWKFEDSRTKRKMVTAVAWCPAYPDLFAVSYGSYDFMKQGSGLICIYTLKNVGCPEYTFTTESGVLCLDWHPNPGMAPLLAVGCYDGTVRVFDVRRKENKHIFACDIKSGKHTDPVWEVRWAPEAPGATLGDLSFYSISSDGRVAAWFITKSDLRMETIMNLKLVSGTGLPGAGGAGGGAGSPEGSASPAADGSGAGGGGASPAADGGAEPEGRTSGLAGGCCFAFNPFKPSEVLLGTEEGKIHALSLDYAGQYSATYTGHHMAVYALRWNPYHPRVFLSCSADWTVRLWDSSHPVAVKVRTATPPMRALSHACALTRLLCLLPPPPPQIFDLGTSVGDVVWAPYSSTVFAAVTDEGKIAVWDMAYNKHEPLCEQKVRHRMQASTRWPPGACSSPRSLPSLALPRSLPLAQIVKKAKCTHLAFNSKSPVVLAGDSTGGVTSLKLSPNLRRVTPIPLPTVKKGEAPPPPPSRLEVEIRKMDALLASTDARITIITPVPGIAKGKAAEEKAEEKEEE